MGNALYVYLPAPWILEEPETEVCRNLGSPTPLVGGLNKMQGKKLGEAKFL